MNKVKVKVKKLHPDAKIPIYATPESAGYDIYSIEDKEISPGKIEIIRTGLSFEIEPGFCYQFWDRSGLGKEGIHKLGGLGDSDYRGEFKVILHNTTEKSFKIVKGDRIMQIAIVPVFRAEFEEVDNLSDTIRGEGGFHSTGRR